MHTAELVARLEPVSRRSRLPMAPPSHTGSSSRLANATMGEQATEVYMQGRSVPYAVVVQRNEVPDFTSIGSGLT